MFKDFKIVSDLFYTEVCLDIEEKYKILGNMDIPLYVFIQYKPDLDIWECTCRLEPLSSKKLTIVRQYTTETIESVKELM